MWLCLLIIRCPLQFLLLPFARVGLIRATRILVHVGRGKCCATLKVVAPTIEIVGQMIYR